MRDRRLLGWMLLSTLLVAWGPFSCGKTVCLNGACSWSVRLTLENLAPLPGEYELTLKIDDASTKCRVRFVPVETVEEVPLLSCDTPSPGIRITSSGDLSIGLAREAGTVGWTLRDPLGRLLSEDQVHPDYELSEPFGEGCGTCGAADIAVTLAELPYIPVPVERGSDCSPPEEIARDTPVGADRRTAQSLLDDHLGWTEASVEWLPAGESIPNECPYGTFELTNFEIELRDGGGRSYRYCDAPLVEVDVAARTADGRIAFEGQAYLRGATPADGVDREPARRSILSSRDPSQSEPEPPLAFYIVMGRHRIGSGILYAENGDRAFFPHLCEPDTPEPE